MMMMVVVVVVVVWVSRDLQGAGSGSAQVEQVELRGVNHCRALAVRSWWQMSDDGRRWQSRAQGAARSA